MLILTVYRAVLLAAPTVSSKLNGGIHYGRVDQNEPRPNILLEMPESGADYTHSGPVGLFDGHLRATCRADTFQAATLLGDAVRAVLEDWTGEMFGCRIQLTEHFNSASGFDDKAQVFTHVSEYTSFFQEIA